MKKSFLFITDAFDSLNHKKDTSIFMMEEALNNGADVQTFQIIIIFGRSQFMKTKCCSTLDHSK